MTNSGRLAQDSLLQHQIVHSGTMMRHSSSGPGFTGYDFVNRVKDVPEVY